MDVVSALVGQRGVRLRCQLDQLFRLSQLDSLGRLNAPRFARHAREEDGNSGRTQSVPVLSDVPGARALDRLRCLAAGELHGVTSEEELDLMTFVRCRLRHEQRQGGSRRVLGASCKMD